MSSILTVRTSRRTPPKTLRTALRVRQASTRACQPRSDGDLWLVDVGPHRQVERTLHLVPRAGRHLPAKLRALTVDRGVQRLGSRLTSLAAGPLTKREHEVAELIESGLSNRENRHAAIHRQTHSRRPRRTHPGRLAPVRPVGLSVGASPRSPSCPVSDSLISQSMPDRPNVGIRSGGCECRYKAARIICSVRANGNAR